MPRLTDATEARREAFDETMRALGAVPTADVTTPATGVVDAGLRVLREVLGGLRREELTRHLGDGDVERVFGR